MPMLKSLIQKLKKKKREEINLLRPIGLLDKDVVFRFWMLRN